MSKNNTPEKINAELIEHANEVGRTCLEACSNCANRHLANYRITDAEQERVPNGIRVWVTCADATQYHIDVFRKSQTFQYVLSDLLRAESLPKLHAAIDTHVRAVHQCYQPLQKK